MSLSKLVTGMFSSVRNTSMTWRLKHNNNQCLPCWVSHPDHSGEGGLTWGAQGCSSENVNQILKENQSGHGSIASCCSGEELTMVDQTWESSLKTEIRAFFKWTLKDT